MNGFNFGIRESLQADIRHEPNACNGYVLDVSLGCSHRCIYCIFTLLEKQVYKLVNKNYDGGNIPLKIDRLLERDEFPPAVYMCYSCDPLAGKEVASLAATALRKLLAHGVAVLFITKGIFHDEILEVIATRPDLMHIQVGITSQDDRRNRLIEPGAPPYAERMANFARLGSITGLGSLTVRIDPMFPTIDDTIDNVATIADAAAALGAQEAVLGYLILTEAIRERLKRSRYLRPAMEELSELTPTISDNAIYSYPFAKKLARLTTLSRVCLRSGLKVAVCGCKEERLKNSAFQWICHPFYRQQNACCVPPCTSNDRMAPLTLNRPNRSDERRLAAAA